MTDYSNTHTLSSEQKAAALSITLKLVSSRPLKQEEGRTLLRDLELGHERAVRSYAEAEMKRVLKKRLGLT